MVVAAIIGAGALSAGASLASGSMAAGAASDATAFDKSVYDTEQKNLAPYLSTGQSALAALASFYGLGGGAGGGGAAPMVTPGTPGAPAIPGTNGAGMLYAGANGLLANGTTPPAGSTPVYGHQSRANPIGDIIGYMPPAGWSPGGSGAPAASGGAAPGGSADSGPLAVFKQFTALPSYQFPFQQGLIALNRSLAARGLGNSGAGTKDALAYGQGYASTGLDKWLAGLGGLATMGQNSAVNTANTGVGIAGNVNNAMLTGGGAQGAGIVGAGNAVNNTLSNFLPYMNSNPSASSYGGYQPYNGPTATDFSMNASPTNFQF